MKTRETNRKKLAETGAGRLGMTGGSATGRDPWPVVGLVALSAFVVVAALVN